MRSLVGHTSRTLRRFVFLTATVLATPCLCAQTPMAPDIVKATGVEAGLAVHIGTTDGALESALAQTGWFVAHGLALDEARRNRARATIQNKGLYGLASVETWREPSRLPYGDRLVSLLIVDRDAIAGAAPDAECLRVLAPKGVLYVCRGGRWTPIVKPRPEAMDDWTHYLHGPEGNEVSHDTLVGPQTALKWLAWYERQADGEATFRAQDGVVFHHATFRGGRSRHGFLVARDAFNGVVLWRRKLEGYVRLQSLTAHNGKLFTALTPERKPPVYVALDARSGALLKTYDRLGLDAYDPRVRNSPLIGDWRAYTALHLGKRFYWVGGKQILCVDEDSGNLLWRFEADRQLIFPAFDEATQRLFVVLAADRGRWSRWPGAAADSVLALDATSGKEAWRCAEAKGKAMGQLTVDGERLMFFNGCANLSYHPDNPGGDSGPGSRGPSAILGTIRIADGKLLWARQFIVEDDLNFGTHGHWVMSAVARGGIYWALGKDALFGYNRDGKLVHDIRPRTVNNRCIRGRATDRFLFFGFGGFIDEDFRWTYQNVTRGACAVGKLPANGMTYQVPGICGCFAYVRGFAGYGSDPPPEDVPDAERLLPGGRPDPVYARPTAPPPTPKVFEAPRSSRGLPFRDLTLGEQPLRDAWVNNDLPVFWETEPVQAGALQLVAVAHEHRLEARQGDRVAWSFAADGRITAPPLVSEGIAYVASHDGHLYALDVASGALRWRFLAGSRRKMMAHGQLESAQPVTNVVLHEGSVCCAAGRHPELDGCILVWALDPKTGAVRRKVAIRRELTWAPPIDRLPKDESFRGYQNVVLNRGLIVEDGQLKLITDPPRYPPIAIDPANPPSGARKADKIRKTARGRAPSR